MVGSKLHDNVERWLVQQNYSYKEMESPENNFYMVIKHLGSFGNSVEIFQPKKQENVIVLGSKVALKNNQNARYLKLTEKEREEGKKKVGVYIVLDKEEQLNQQSFLESLQQVTEMSDKTNQFLLKVF